MLLQNSSIMCIRLSHVIGMQLVLVMLQMSECFSLYSFSWQCNCSRGSYIGRSYVKCKQLQLSVSGARFTSLLSFDAVGCTFKKNRNDCLLFRARCFFLYVIGLLVKKFEHRSIIYCVKWSVIICDVS